MSGNSLWVTRQFDRLYNEPVGRVVVARNARQVAISPLGDIMEGGKTVRSSEIGPVAGQITPFHDELGNTYLSSTEVGGATIRFIRPFVREWYTLFGVGFSRCEYAALNGTNVSDMPVVDLKDLQSGDLERHVIGVGSPESGIVSVGFPQLTRGGLKLSPQPGRILVAGTAHYRREQLSGGGIQVYNLGHLETIFP